ncbi:putative UDP-glucosyl transferase 73B3 [Hibiscus syriacus]|uniref:UDP-glucosyl transferase 73B3 n=1 Tax=Hibiscus syriacus TaxID=106335 RepID=A0A6A3A5U9_HIBSY|nr:putative UDP-glucosyl transferase 73B3 [Hibiscus syriacus]
MRREIHMFFLAYLALGHVIPTVDMAKLFSSQGVKTTVVTTPVNASLFSRTIERSKEYDSLPTSTDGNREMSVKFFQAVRLLQEPFEKLLQEFKPDCLVADLFFSWATDAANKFGIPRLVFHGTGYFSLCASECIRLYQPHKKVQSDAEPFVVPNLPGNIELTKNRLPGYIRQDVETDFTKRMEAATEAELKSYGAWHIGPLSLCIREDIDKAERGKKSAIDEHECLKWLDSKEPNSVLYICFGSMSCFTSAQLKEIVMALEALDLQFIWVVSKQKKDEEDNEWLPEGFEKRREGKGLIIRGWAPQVLILDHEAVGGFVTHCGWSSTWPTFAEQFFNEKLVTQVLKIGVDVGAQKWARLVEDFVKMEAIEKAVKELMKGDKADEMRNRAKALAEAAKKANKKGGSSHSDLNALIEELSSRSQ